MPVLLLFSFFDLLENALNRAFNWMENSISRLTMMEFLIFLALILVLLFSLFIPLVSMVKKKEFKNPLLELMVCLGTGTLATILFGFLLLLVVGLACFALRR